MDSDVDKLNIGILRPVSNHLNNFKANLKIPDNTKFQTIRVDLKKQMNNWLVTKVNNDENKSLITTGLTNKSKYDTEKRNLEQTIKDVDKKVFYPSALIKKQIDAKITETENKTLDTSSLVKKKDYYDTNITETEKNITGVTGLIKKTCYDTKLDNISNRVISVKIKTQGMKLN